MSLVNKCAICLQFTNQGRWHYACMEHYKPILITWSVKND